MMMERIQYRNISRNSKFVVLGALPEIEIGMFHPLASFFNSQKMTQLHGRSLKNKAPPEENSI
eukprot:scaffold423_cov61-Cylindrotheca_fusiformis.AAC.3